MTPLPMVWDGESLRPASPYWAKRADAEYVIGERYQIAPIEERSAASHAHYFAAVNEVWANLPEELAERLPTSEHLRKYALIKCGFADQRQIVCASKAEAQRVAAFIRPMDDYAIVGASEAVVTVWTAQSQSFRAMGKQRFGESKERVLAFLASLIAVEPEALSQRAREAA